MTEAYPGDGKMVNSAQFNGTSTDDSVAKVTAWLEQQNTGHKAVHLSSCATG